ncbi:MAG: toxin-antitoxin system TumE family protein [Devosia sp.]
MKAVLIYRFRKTFEDRAFSEAVVWRLPTPSPGSRHGYKYRLALVVEDECVLRYDNERGKGDHRHVGDREESYDFTTLDALFDAFDAEVARILG